LSGAADSPTFASTQDLPRVPLGEGEEGSEIPPPFAPPGDPRLAQIVQHMASFTARTGESDWKERDPAIHTRYDYFAA
jgi:hypothetical protein